MSRLEAAQIVASCHARSDGKETVANAVLIAAAPDLLSAVKAFLNAQTCDEMDVAITEGQAAVRKAVGL